MALFVEYIAHRGVFTTLKKALFFLHKNHKFQVFVEYDCNTGSLWGFLFLFKRIVFPKSQGNKMFGLNLWLIISLNYHCQSGFSFLVYTFSLINVFTIISQSSSGAKVYLLINFSNYVKEHKRARKKMSVSNPSYIFWSLLY